MATVDFIRSVDLINERLHARSAVFGKSITQREPPRARRVTPIPRLPWRAFALAAIAVIGSGYAIARHYARTAAATPPPAVDELPAPELEPLPAHS